MQIRQADRQTERQTDQEYPKHNAAAEGKMQSATSLNQQTRDFDPMLDHCWASVVNGGPTLVQHFVDVSCLLGRSLPAIFIVLPGSLSLLSIHTVQSQKAVTAHFTSKQLLPFGFVGQFRSTYHWLKQVQPSMTRDLARPRDTTR